MLLFTIDQVVSEWQKTCKK